MSALEQALAILAGLAAIIGAAGGIGGIAAWRSSRHTAHKADIDALAVALKSLREDYERLDRENDDLRKRLAELEKAVAEWRKRYADLAEWVRKQGLDPEQRKRGGDGVGVAPQVAPP